MEKHNAIRLFDGRQVRALWDPEDEKWFFSIVDVVGVLSDRIIVDTAFFCRTRNSAINSNHAS